MLHDRGGRLLVGKDRFVSSFLALVDAPFGVICGCRTGAGRLTDRMISPRVEQDGRLISIIGPLASCFSPSSPSLTLFSCIHTRLTTLLLIPAQ